MEEPICHHCNKVCKNHNSWRNHVRCCPKNPNRNYKNGMLGKKGRNQYTKAKETGIPYAMSDETKQKISRAAKNRKLSKETRNKISNTVNEKISNNEWHVSLARHHHYRYKGIDLHGSWELKYAKWLDYNGIKWIRCKESFQYEFDNKVRQYTPDFYLPDTDEYIEIKGYKTDKDTAKWNQFPRHKKLKVLLQEDLKEMGVI